jgi:methionyl aminopeptidase
VEAKAQARRDQRTAQARARTLVAQTRAGGIWAEVAAYISEWAVPGITTAELDLRAERFVLKLGATPTNKGYQGAGPYPYPRATCFMPNDAVTHGIPDDRELRDGDILTFDMGVTYDGVHADAAITLAIGEISDEAKHLIRVCESALYAGIAQAKPGGHVGDISHAIESTIQPSGFGIVDEFCGHGIGTTYHAPPQVPNTGRSGKGPVLQEGMVLAIEPIITAGSGEIRFGDDGWTVYTDDGSLAAQFEHTVLVADSPEILTRIS